MKKKIVFSNPLFVLTPQNAFGSKMHSYFVDCSKHFETHGSTPNAFLKGQIIKNSPEFWVSFT